MKIAVATSFQNFPSNLENMADLRKIFRAGAAYLRGRGEFHHKNEGAQSKISCVFSGQGRICQRKQARGTHDDNFCRFSNFINLKFQKSSKMTIFINFQIFSSPTGESPGAFRGLIEPKYAISPKFWPYEESESMIVVGW